MKRLVQKSLNKLGLAVIRSTQAEFQTSFYLRHNARRLEHLASLHLPVRGATVLEVGAGIGDLSHYYIDRDCQITITEARPSNLSMLRRRYPGHNVEALDMEHPDALADAPFDIVHCYGLLYHLRTPEQALRYLADCCGRMLLLETWVSFGDTQDIPLEKETQANVTQAFSGVGCRPSRRWVYEQLSNLFPYVYVPRTQPNHAEFPLDWTAPEKHNGSIARAIFIASRIPISNPVLHTDLMDVQVRHE